MIDLNKVMRHFAVILLSNLRTSFFEHNFVPVNIVRDFTFPNNPKLGASIVDT